MARPADKRGQSPAPDGGGEAPALEQVLDALPTGIVLTQRDGGILTANAAARSLLGEDVVGRPIGAVLHDRAGAPLDAVMEGLGWRTVLPARPGLESGRLEARSLPLPSGPREGVLWQIRVPEVVALRDDRSLWLAALVESSEDAILSKTLDGTIVSWNAAATRLFGYTPEEVVGRHVTILVPPERHDEEAEILRQVRKGLRVPPYDTQRMRKDGELIEVSLAVSPIFDREGRVVGAAGINHNISHRRAREALLEQRGRELERSNRALEQFAYVASHDLQEPLRMVASYTQLLQRRYEGRLDAEADEFIAYAVDGARRMQSLINDLLVYARARTQSTVRAPVEMDECLAAALSNLASSIAEAGARVESDALPVVQGNKRQLVQLLQNLVGNAIKFRGDEPPRIRIAARAEDDGWHFSVADNGIGLDDAYAERIFGVFQRLHGTGTYPGTGIGLAICREIVAHHGGRIWVESTPGKGATFHFTIDNGGSSP